MGFKSSSALRLAGGAVFDRDGKPKSHIARGIERAVEVQRPLVLANIRRLQRRHPEASAAELVKILEKHYLGAVTGGGAAVGATAVVPAVGTAAALGLSAAATFGFLEATALYAQSVAELHGVRLQDPERSRTVVMAIMLGEEGTAMMQQLGKGKPWGSAMGSASSGMLGSVGSSIRRQFMRKMLAKQGSVIIGRALPLGIGAVIGGAGNYTMGRSVINATHRAFGEAPGSIPGELAEEIKTLPERKSA
jgi:hypothetical protein